MNPSRYRKRLRLAAIVPRSWRPRQQAGSSNPLGGGSASGDLKSVVVGSADFPESKIIAEIYAQALEANGFNVGRQFGIGSRETYVRRGTTRSTWCRSTPETCCSTSTRRRPSPRPMRWNLPWPGASR